MTRRPAGTEQASGRRTTAHRRGSARRFIMIQAAQAALDIMIGIISITGKRQLSDLPRPAQAAAKLGRAGRTGTGRVRRPWRKFLFLEPGQDRDCRSNLSAC